MFYHNIQRNMDVRPLQSFVLLLLPVTFFTGSAHSAVIRVGEDNPTIISCDLGVQYPKWVGPDGLANPLTNGQTIREPGMEWANNKDLRIAQTMLKHDGNYTCSDQNGNSRTTEVDVEYFSASAYLTAASPQNTTAVFTCSCHSNPPCKITPFVVSHFTSDNSRDKTTFEECVPDPARENRTMCRVISTLGMAKEYNGLRENRCEFEYKGIKKHLTLFEENTFYFPPTYVNITANKDDKVVTLNCSTDSSNPVAVLNWYKGNKAVASNNLIFIGSQRLIVEAEYYGRNVSEVLDINIDDIEENDKVFCCAKQVESEICESIPLSDFRKTSSGYRLTSLMVLIIAGVAVVII